MVIQMPVALLLIIIKPSVIASTKVQLLAALISIHLQTQAALLVAMLVTAVVPILVQLLIVSIWQLLQAMDVQAASREEQLVICKTAIIWQTYQLHQQLPTFTSVQLSDKPNPEPPTVIIPA